MKKLLLLLSVIAVAAATHAQDDQEYRLELGAGAGMVAYEGDFNGSILKGMQPMTTLLVRRVINPYMGLRASLSFGKLKGSSGDVTTFYPDYKDNPVDFSSSLTDFGLAYEYNFCPYGTGRDYRGAKRLTPFVFLGIGATYAKIDEESVFTANVPLGIGVKYKIGARVNFGIEWAMHFTLSDKLDGVEDPYWIKSAGLFKNTDCYSALQLTITYSLMPKCRTCNKD